MNIMYTCDNNYVWLMAISTISLFENNKEMDDLSVYFFIIITDLTHLCIDVISYNTSMCHEVFPPLVSNKNILSKLFFCCKFLHRDCQCFILQ